MGPEGNKHGPGLAGTVMSTQVVATAFGGPEALAVVHEDVPAPGPGQVTVAVRAAGMNPIDFKLYSGHMGSDTSTLPMPVGNEVSGVVTAVGDGARGRAGVVAVGDEVIAYPITGGYADAVTVDASSITPKPASMSFEDAAGLMLTGATAVHGLTAVGIVAGTTVLVHGVSGGVGLTVAQIAIADGATVVGTASERHHESLRARGVVPVAYGEGLLERVREAAPDGVDGAFDCVGTDEAVDVSLALVADPRLVVTIAAFGRGGDGIAVIGGAENPGTEIRDSARLRLTALVDDGHLEVVVARTFPLAQAAEATALLAGGHAGGKVVLVP